MAPAVRSAGGDRCSDEHEPGDHGDSGLAHPSIGGYPEEPEAQRPEDDQLPAEPDRAGVGRVLAAQVGLVVHGLTSCDVVDGPKGGPLAGRCRRSRRRCFASADWMTCRPAGSAVKACYIVSAHGRAHRRLACIAGRRSSVSTEIHWTPTGSLPFRYLGTGPAPARRQPQGRPVRSRLANGPSLHIVRNVVPVGRCGSSRSAGSRRRK